MFLRGLLRSIAITTIICAPMAVPRDDAFGPPWWLAAALTAFWGTFGAVVVCPATREYMRGW